MNEDERGAEVCEHISNAQTQQNTRLFYTLDTLDLGYFGFGFILF